MTRHIETESGAHYEVSNDGDHIRRWEGESGNTKRADGAWVRLLRPLSEESLVGHRAVLTLESLNDRGPDDYGTEKGSLFSAGWTTRTTTPVVRDEVRA